MWDLSRPILLLGTGEERKRGALKEARFPKMCMACGRLGYHHPHCPEADDYNDGNVIRETLADRIATIRLFERKEQGGSGTTDTVLVLDF